MISPARGQLARHLGGQVHDVAVALHHHHLVDHLGPEADHPAHVVARQVHQHHVLCHLLRVFDELAGELVEDPKEVAEHVMLVDLARNDVGRVVSFGTEVVDEMMVVERYSHIMHLTSQVSGQLAPGRGPIDVLRATIPAGTLSGAPKVRAMEIIDDLEPTRRGVYGGVVGYLDFSGNLDTAIAIRTMTVTPDGRASVQAGAGI